MGGGGQTKSGMRLPAGYLFNQANFRCGFKRTKNDYIKNKSVVAWEHINLGGTYDFSNESLSDEYNFNRELLLNVEI